MRSTEKQSGDGGLGQAAPPVVDYSSALAAIPQFAHLGPLFKSSSPVHLTEEETEYSIYGIKHIFPDHILLQFDCTNTVPEQILENVVVLIDLAEAVRTSLPSPPPAVSHLVTLQRGPFVFSCAVGAIMIFTLVVLLLVPSLGPVDLDTVLLVQSAVLVPLSVALFKPT